MMAQPPSADDIKAMAELTSLMDDIENGNPTKNLRHNNTTNIPNDLLSVATPDTTGDKQAMAAILEGIDSITGVYSNNTYDSSPDLVLPVDASESDIHNALTKNATSNNTNVVPQVPYNHSGPEYSIVKESYKNSKMHCYSIKNNITRTVVADCLVLKESAVALQSLLNSKVTFTDPVFVGALSMALQYSQVFNETFTRIQKRQKVLKECNYDAAKQMDDVIAKGKIKADNIRKDLINFLIKEGIKYK